MNKFELTIKKPCPAVDFLADFQRHILFFPPKPLIDNKKQSAAYVSFYAKPSLQEKTRPDIGTSAASNVMRLF